MKIVIAGGTGTIGRALTNHLAAHGHKIVVLTRTPEANSDIESENVSVAFWQVDTIDGWGSFVDGANAVINFAGENLAGEKFLPDRWTDEKLQRIRESRVATGNAITRAIEMAEKKPQTLIQASAIGYYGPRDDEVVTEKSEPGSDLLADICVEWESTTDLAEEMGLRRAVIRTGLILDKESGPLPRILVRFKMLAGGPFGGGNQWWSWIHLQDVVRAVHFLLENDTASGPFNLTSPNPTTNREFSRVLGQVMSRPSFVPLPGFALKMVVGEVATVVLDGQRVVPEALANRGFTFSFPQLDQALKDILG